MDSSDTSLSRQQLDGILQDPDHTPDDVLNFLDGRFKEELDSDAGVWEGYTIREHTGMVMSQHRRYLSGELPDTVKPEVFELVLALHDIGKPEAIQNGSKQQQHRYTVPVVREAMADLDFGDEDIAVATALIDGDPIGQTLKTGSIEKNAKRVIEMAGESGLELEDFWQALLVYYMSDASAYTTDAGGQPSLDFLFQFNPAEGKLSFAPEQQQVVDGLKQAVFKAAGDTNIRAKRESKLSPAQQEQVRSAEFIEWFGDWENDPDGPNTSKIVDLETGEPKVFYHGTNRQFDISQAPDDAQGKLSNYGQDHDYKGVYVTDAMDLAKTYADPLGGNWNNVMSSLIRQLDDTPHPTINSAYEIWNSILLSCKKRDGSISIGNDDLSLSHFEALLESGNGDYDAPLKFNGRTVMQVGEFLRYMGGSFPGSREELVSYQSLYPIGDTHKVLIPQSASPNIIPVFVNSKQPIKIKAPDTMSGMDESFITGFDTIEKNRLQGHDAIVVDWEDATFWPSQNIAVISHSQLVQAGF